MGHIVSDQQVLITIVLLAENVTILDVVNIKLQPRAHELPEGNHIRKPEWLFSESFHHTSPLCICFMSTETYAQPLSIVGFGFSFMKQKF